MRIEHTFVIYTVDESTTTLPSARAQLSLVERVRLWASLGLLDAVGLQGERVPAPWRTFRRSRAFKTSANLQGVGSSTAQPQSTLEALGGEPGVVSFFGFENITIIVWHAKPSLAAAQHLMRVSMRRRAEFAHGISVVHLVQVTFEMPDAVTRDAFVKLLRDGGGKLAVLCLIVGTGGFWASALRSLITGLRVLSRDSFDLGLFTDVGEALDFLLPRHLSKTGAAISREQLSSALTKCFSTS